MPDDFLKTFIVVAGLTICFIAFLFVGLGFALASLIW